MFSMKATLSLIAAIRTLFLIGLPLITSLADTNDEVSIKLAKNQSDAERRTEQQLRRILAACDLSRWTFSRSVVIDEREIPSSAWSTGQIKS